MGKKSAIENKVVVNNVVLPPKRWQYFVTITRKIGPFSMNVNCAGLTGIPFTSASDAMDEVYEHYKVASETWLELPPDASRGVVCFFKLKKFFLSGKIYGVLIG